MLQTLLALVWGCDRTPDPVGRPNGGLGVNPPAPDSPASGTDPTTPLAPPTGPDPLVPNWWWPVGWLRVRVDHDDPETLSGRLEGARVLVSGLEATTDNWGFAEVIGVPNGRMTVEVRAEGFPTLYRSIVQTPDHPAAAWFSAEKELSGWSFDASTGGTFVDGATTIEVAPYALVDEDGITATGTIEASVTALTDGTHAAMLPSLETADGVALLGLAAGWIAFESEGAPLTIDPGTPITMSLPIVPASGASENAGLSYPSWVYDPTLGEWKLGPSALAGRDNFTWSVDRPGWWIVAATTPSDVCYTGRLVDQDNLIASRAHLRVKSTEGLVHRAFASKLDGTFCVCGPSGVPLWLSSWMFRPPTDEISSIGLALDGSSDESCDHAPTHSVGDVTAIANTITCITGTLDPPVPGCTAPYTFAWNYTLAVARGELTVGEDGDPTFCLTLPADHYAALPDDFVYPIGRRVTCALEMGCQRVGPQSCE